MKSKRLFHAVLLSVFAWLFLMAGIAGATGITLSASTAKLDMTPATTFANGESFYLLIKVNEATGVAGAALTVEYDSALFDVDETNVSGNDYFIAASNTFLTVTDARTPPGTPASAVPSLGNQTTAGKVMLSGAFINPNATTGGGGAYTGEQTLFKVKFRAKAVGGPVVFTVKQSLLQNPAAGWGTAETAEAAPVLVGAVPKTDANFTNLALAFPVLLGNEANPFTAIQATGITVVAGIPISGTITYTGKQTGTLNVGAFTDAAFQNLVGQGFQVAWPGSSQAYTVYVPTAGTYYLAGFIMSGAAHEDPNATDAFGTYGSALTITAAADGKNFTLRDPDANANNLPDWWEVKYGIYSATTPVGQNADQDNDGYSNLVEYQSYVSEASPGQNPTVADAPGGTGYNPATDNRSYGVSGTIYYSGVKTGTLYVAAFAPTDTTYATPIGAQSYAWTTGKASQAYTLNIPNGTYNLAAFIGASATRQTTDAQGAYGANVTLAGTALTAKNFTLTDPDQKKQMVSASPSSPSGRAGGTVTFSVNYTTSDSNKTLTGLGLKIHYNSSKLTWVSFDNVLATDKIGQDTGPQADTLDLDNDPTTDKYLLIAWASTGGAWPNVDLPAALYSVTFTVAEGLADGDTSMIRFSSEETAEGYIFYSDPVTFKVQSFNLDADGNAQAKALSDGLLIIRYLFGFTGDTLISGAVGSGATRTTADAIKAYLDSGGLVLDVDGNGSKKALSDGLLTIRYLFGFSGDTLISGAVGSGATRTTSDAIKAYLLPLKP